MSDKEYRDRYTVKSCKEIIRLKAMFDCASSDLKTDYWSEESLALYSESLGERIRWKWNSFLEDLKVKKIHLETLFPNRSFQILDWGCGPGTASLAFAESFQNTNFLNFTFEDRSQLAKSFAAQRIRNFLKRDPTPEGTHPLRVILVSYVLSELNLSGEKALLQALRSHDAFCWVDAGSHKESRKLSEIRNLLADEFYFLAPCPHQDSCPLSLGAHPADWCHRFAKAPAEAFHSAKWAELSKILNIDLRSLPYSSLFAVKKSLLTDLKIPALSPQQLGRPFVGKIQIGVAQCTPEGRYEMLQVFKRKDPAEFKRLKKL